MFIGKNLDKEQLKKGFESCILTPELLANKVAGLRFKLGDNVECKTGQDDDEWSKGKVVNIMWRDDETMPTGITAPYQIELTDGTLIYAPYDDDQIIRRPSKRASK